MIDPRRCRIQGNNRTRSRTLDESHFLPFTGYFRLPPRAVARVKCLCDICPGAPPGVEAWSVSSRSRCPPFGFQIQNGLCGSLGGLVSNGLEGLTSPGGYPQLACLLRSGQRGASWAILFGFQGYTGYDEVPSTHVSIIKTIANKKKSKGIKLHGS